MRKNIPDLNSNEDELSRIAELEEENRALKAQVTDQQALIDKLLNTIQQIQSQTQGVLVTHPIKKSHKGMSEKKPALFATPTQKPVATVKQFSRHQPNILNFDPAILRQEFHDYLNTSNVEQKTLMDRFVGLLYHLDPAYFTFPVHPLKLAITILDYEAMEFILKKMELSTITDFDAFVQECLDKTILKFIPKPESFSSFSNVSTYGQCFDNYFAKIPAFVNSILFTSRSLVPRTAPWIVFNTSKQVIILDNPAGASDLGRELNNELKELRAREQANRQRGVRRQRGAQLLQIRNQNREERLLEENCSIGPLSRAALGRIYTDCAAAHENISQRLLAFADTLRQDTGSPRLDT